MIFRELRHVSTHGYYRYIPGFEKAFPELSKIDKEEMSERFDELNIHFYEVVKTKVSPIIRITLPIALIVMALMFVLLPFNFIITGRWGFSNKNKIVNTIFNWFSALNLNF